VIRNLMHLIKREPAALGTLVASVLPVLVLLGIVNLDEAGIAAIVLAINTVVGFCVRLLVSPVAAAPAPAPSGNAAAAPTPA
jgi:hypothetical protein